MDEILVKRGNQDIYNSLLDAFDAKSKGYQECVYYLVSEGYLYSQAKSAVYVYFKGGDTHSTSTLTSEIRNELLDNFGAIGKSHKESVNYLMSKGYTYRQANTASYRYRKERGLVHKNRA